uniref:ATP synthase subunit delta n=1 Tax=Candidatus Kentrum sp. LFY TaxID=2126342 RepID=A0A450UJW7_9GAMM|nr:MAG: F-type H+-transporting ATPase subunit delta [Candidatus Kentron sp. LFY]
MVEKYTLARPYALAAFKLAQEDGKFNKWLEILRFAAMVVSDPKVARIIRDPRVSKSHLIELVLDVANGKFFKTGEDFISVLVYTGRMGIAREVLHLFEKELDIFKNRARVKVVSAYPLAPAYQQDIRTAMTKRLGREVDTSMIVDRSLIGGVVIRIGDAVIDISLRGRLTQLGLDLS